MHFDQRTRRALRAVGLEAGDIGVATEAVAGGTAALESFDEHGRPLADEPTLYGRVGAR